MRITPTNEIIPVLMLFKAIPLSIKEIFILIKVFIKKRHTLRHDETASVAWQSSLYVEDP